jgi:hypothetical protein
MNTKVFTAEVDGKDVDFLVRTPSLQEQREGQKIYNQAFSDAVKAKAIVRARMDDLLEEQGLWDDSKQAELTRLQQAVLDGERTLAKGGIPLKQAREIAVEMKRTRAEIRDLISVKTSLDNHSAEGQADNARFNYLVSACLVYNDNKQPYFKSLEDYLSKSSDPVAIRAAQNLANMLYGLDNDYESNLPENKFLKKFKFVDDKLRFINKEGKLVDEEGRLINENGRYVNENGEFVDKNGNRVDENGDYVVESQPFLDDEGNPILEEDEPVSTPEPVSAEVPSVVPENVATTEVPTTTTSPPATTASEAPTSA